MTPLAVANADVLRRLAAAPAPSIAALAREFCRDPANLRKTLKLLQGEGSVHIGSISALQGRDGVDLTAAGRALVAALDGLPGRTDAGQGLLRVAHAALRPNPLNPRKAFDADALEALAATIEADGDIIEPLVVSPPAADGLRTIWAGERRWRAVGLLLADDSLSLEGSVLQRQGLPCVERPADAGQALFIAVVENSQRENLTPWEDACALRDLADATGWSARELAFRIGRAAADAEGGVRDVQRKIRTAREASPEAIAQYEIDGDWEALRESVQTAKAPASPAAAEDPMWVNGVRYPNETMASEARRRFNGERAGASTPPRRDATTEQALPLDAPSPWPTLSPGDAHVLLELAHRTRAGVMAADWVTVGKYWLDAAAARLQTLRLIAFRQAETPMALVTELGEAWLTAHGHALPISVAALRAAHVRRFSQAPALGASLYATPWIDPVAVALGDQRADDMDGVEAEQLAPIDTDEDDPQVADDRATLAQVDSLFDGFGDTGGVNDDALRNVITRLGLAFPLRTGVDSDSGVVMDANGEPILIVDVNRENTDERARAIAKLVVLALTYITADPDAAGHGRSVENSSAPTPPPAADDAQEADEEIPGFLRRLAGAADQTAGVA